ncbi:hypothetical protein [Rossellomorea aquimaris]|nr:hypothetical protein [Rossellomorea aquimaris]
MKNFVKLLIGTLVILFILKMSIPFTTVSEEEFPDPTIIKVLS